MENAIIAQNIKRYFKAGDGATVHALDGVSMEIKKGTLAILKGRSGCESGGDGSKSGSGSNLFFYTDNNLCFPSDHLYGWTDPFHHAGYVSDDRIQLICQPDRGSDGSTKYECNCS